LGYNTLLQGFCKSCTSLHTCRWAIISRNTSIVHLINNLATGTFTQSGDITHYRFTDDQRSGTRCRAGRCAPDRYRSINVTWLPSGWLRDGGCLCVDSWLFCLLRLLGLWFNCCGTAHGATLAQGSHC